MGDSMTDKRDIEDRVSDLRDRLGSGEQTIVARRNLSTGDLKDFDGNPIDPDDHEADKLVVFEEALVMSRQQAESENREIIGEYADAPEGRDLIEVVDYPFRAHGGT